MNQDSQQNQSPDVMKQLVTLVYDSVRELKEKRYPVTEQSLYKTMSKNSELARLLRIASSGELQTEVSSEPPDAESEQVQLRLDTLNKQKVRLLRDVQQLEDQLQELWDFTLGALLMFSAWIEASKEKTPFVKAVAKFKERLKGVDQFLALETAFSELKEKVFKQDVTGHRKEEGGRKFSFKGWLGRRERTSGGSEAQQERWLSELQATLGAFLEQLENLSEDQVTQRLAELKANISQCRSFGELVAFREELVEVGYLCANFLEGEREQFNRLVQEVDQSLRAIETNLLDSLGGASAMLESHSRFDDQLEQRMDELSESAESSKSLEDLRHTLVSKLSLLRQALETKRQDDEKRMAEINDKMEKLQESVALMRREVDHAQEQTKVLAEQVLTDPLTGVLGRRGYEERLAQEFDRFRRYGHTVSLIVFDVDHFKQINDRFGHITGDRCLKAIARYIQSIIRKTDALARYGGDEFVLVLPGIDANQAGVVAEKVRKLVEQMRFLFEGERLPLTLSLGVAQSQQGDDDPLQVFERADEALYRAKEGGRNRVMVAGATG